MRDLACLSHWFPILQSSGVPVPETRIVLTNVPLDDALEGGEVHGMKPFLASLTAAAMEVGGFPCFLRTGHSSDKHGWADSCYVAKEEALTSHVLALVEFSLMVDMSGLPFDVWAVRRLIDLEIVGKAFSAMPIAVERRYFIYGPRVVCHHPYWPIDAVEHGKPSPGTIKRLTRSNVESPEEVAELTALSEQVAKAFVEQRKGSDYTAHWSLDWAKRADGTWVAIDMAPARLSYHWPNCRAVP